MKALVRKELSEQLRISVIGLIIYTILILVTYQNSIRIFEQFVTGQMFGQMDALQPLLASGFYLSTGCFCAIFGAVLGRLQIRSERHRDLWAFLVHRPVPRTTIFLSKVIAGLTLYTVVVGLPLIGLITAVATPGHIPAPFEWAMVLPALGYFFAGILFYFAGLLAGVRQARWYASQGLVLGIALLVALGVGNLPDFRQVLLTLVIGGAILATAVWGSFQSNGFYRNQPVLGKAATTLSVAFGSMIVLFVAAACALSVVRTDHRDSTNYQMTRDGVIYKVTQHANGQTEIVDLHGVPLVDSHTGHPLDRNEFNKRAASSYFIAPNFDASNRDDHYHAPGRFFLLWQSAPQTLWYWTRQGKMVAYDLLTRLPSGTLEVPANGSDASAPEKFRRPMNSYYLPGPWQGPHTLATSTTAYHVNLENRTAKPIVTTTGSNRIGASRDVGASDALVLTRDLVQLVRSNGAPVWQVPFPGYPEYGSLSVYFLEGTNTYAVWFTPSYEANKKADWKLPTHIVWAHEGELASTNSALTSIDLPVERPRREGYVEQKVLSVLAPSLIYPVVGVVVGIEAWREGMTFLPFTLSAAFVCVLLSGWLGARHSTSIRSRLTWALFLLLFGVPGFIAYLSVQEWPAREPCPNCRKRRAVDREHCEHCGAAFAPPPKNGTEIFEPLTVG